MKSNLIFVTCLLCMTSVVFGQTIQDIFGPVPQAPQNTVEPVDDEYWDALDDFVPFEGAQNDEFDWNLLKTLNKRNSDNLLVSPLSIKLLLTMMSDAARGETLKELRSVLQLPENPQATRERVKTVLDSLKVQHKDYTLEIGTRLYLSENIRPRQRFAAIIKMFYNTDLVPLDYSKKEESVEIVNNWVGNVTHGKIKDLVSSDDLENAVLLMLNAIYFKGSWRQSFLSNETKPGSFYLTPNQQITVDFMSRTGQYFFLESKELDAKILRIPYRGRKFSMFFILPNSKGGLSQIIDDMTSVVLRRHLWLMDELEVKVEIPKFKFDVTSQLSETLKEMGLNSLFSDFASLPGLARGVNPSQKLSVSNVLQKAGLEVNEQGSTLYAATEIVLTNKFGSEGSYEFIASRPFLFFVEDETTGSILFSGKVVNPLSGKTEILDTKKPNKTPGLTNRFSDFDNEQSKDTNPTPAVKQPVQRPTAQGQGNNNNIKGDNQGVATNLPGPIFPIRTMLPILVPVQQTSIKKGGEPSTEWQWHYICYYCDYV